MEVTLRRFSPVAPLLGAVLAVPASMITVFLYLLWPLGETLGESAVASLPWSAVLLPAAVPLGGLVGVIFALTRHSRSLAMVALRIGSAALAGVAVAWWATHGSVHISTQIAAAEAAIVWTTVAVASEVFAQSRAAA